MNAKEWNEGLNYLDPALLEDFMQQKERLDQQIKRKNIWLRLGAAAACVWLLGDVYRRLSLLPVSQTAKKKKIREQEEWNRKLSQM